MSKTVKGKKSKKKNKQTNLAEVYLQNGRYQKGCNSHQTRHVY